LLEGYPEMKLSCVALCGVVGLTALLVGGAANATFVLDTNPVAADFNFNGTFHGVESFSGTVGSNTITGTTNENVDVANGLAGLSIPGHDVFTSVTFDPVNGIFNEFSFRGQLASAGPLTLSVISNDNPNPQTFTFQAPANADFGAFGIRAAQGSNETINSLSITSAGFNSIKQVGFGSAIPETSTWAMMLLGFAGIGFIAYRRSSRRPPFRWT
jgi:hypothetical protein